MRAFALALPILIAAATARAELGSHGHVVNAVAFAPDGRIALSASWDNTVALWDLATGAELRELDGHGQSVNALAVSPDGTRFASASWDRTVRL